MTDPKDPPRLVDSSDAPQGLRDLLGGAQNDVGSPQQVARLAERLGPLLAPPVVPPTATAAGTGAAVKLGLVGVALIVAGAGAWLLSTRQTASPSAPISAHAAPAPEPAAVAVPAAPIIDGSTPLASESEPPNLANLPDKPAPRVQLSEADLLEQARTALKSDPARALARANEHRRRFPGGVLVQEREVIAIQALRQLGRASEADQRAAAFAKAFPGSAFQRKLQSSP